jgi:hypothetical protein
MKSKPVLCGAALALSLGLAACGSGSSSSSPTTSANQGGGGGGRGGGGGGGGNGPTTDAAYLAQVNGICQSLNAKSNSENANFNAGGGTKTVADFVTFYSQQLSEGKDVIAQVTAITPPPDLAVGVASALGTENGQVVPHAQGVLDAAKALDQSQVFSSSDVSGQIDALNSDVQTANAKWNAVGLTACGQNNTSINQ